MTETRRKKRLQLKFADPMYWPGVRANSAQAFAMALGLLTSALAFVALWEVTPFFGGWPGPALLPLSGYYENIAFHALSADGGEGRTSRIKRAEAATKIELSLSPMASDAWTRLAYVESLKGPRLDGQGVEALKRSFQVAPLDPVNCGDRDILALNAWADLPPDLRQKVLVELRTLWRPPVVSHPETLAAWRRQVRDPSGQFAVLLTLGPAPAN